MNAMSVSSAASVSASKATASGGAEGAKKLHGHGTQSAVGTAKLSADGTSTADGAGGVASEPTGLAVHDEAAAFSFDADLAKALAPDLGKMPAPERPSIAADGEASVVEPAETAWVPAWFQLPINQTATLSVAPEVLTKSASLPELSVTQEAPANDAQLPSLRVLKLFADLEAQPEPLKTPQAAAAVSAEQRPVAEQLPAAEDAPKANTQTSAQPANTTETTFEGASLSDFGQQGEGTPDDQPSMRLPVRLDDGLAARLSDAPQFVSALAQELVEVRSSEASPKAAGSRPSPGLADPASLLRQLSDGARLRADGGAMTIRLDPADLGKVEVKVEVDGDLARVIFVTERPEVGALVQQHLDTLRAELLAQGLHLGDVEISQSGAEPERSQDGESEGGAGGSEQPGVDDETTEAHPPARADALIDVRI